MATSLSGMKSESVALKTSWYGASRTASHPGVQVNTPTSVKGFHEKLAEGSSWSTGPPTTVTVTSSPSGSEAVTLKLSVVP